MIDDSFDGTFHDSSLPKRIAGFEIKSELGRGRFGVVYLGYDGEFNRQVAIKQPLLLAMLDESARRRFLREAEIASRLDHPNIVAVHSVDESDGVPFIVSEYVEGSNLSEWLDNRGSEPVPINEAVELLRQIADGIALAHQRGILHRDIKPENILVGPDGRNPRVTDFGLGRVIEEDDSLSASHAIIGTPSHMSPEQAAGRRNEVDVRSEVWSLGVVLYRLLTGRMPFESKNHAAILVEILSSPVPPLRSFRREISADLEAVCQKCLQKEPAQRYQSALDLIRDLKCVRHGEPTYFARPRSKFSMAWSWVTRHPTSSLLAGLSLMTVIAGPVSWSAYQNMQLEVETKEQLAKQEQLNTRFVTLTGDVRQRIVRQPPGWIEANKADFQELAGMPQFPANAPVVRDDWFATLIAEEWEQIPWEVPEGHYDYFAESPDGNWFAIIQTRADLNPTIEVYLYNALTLTRVHTFQLPVKPAKSNSNFDNPVDGGKALTFSPDGNKLYASTRSGWVYVCETSDGQVSGGWEAFDEFIGDIEASPDGSRLYVCGRFSNVLRAFSARVPGILLAESDPPDGESEPDMDQAIMCHPDRNHLHFSSGKNRPWRLDPVTLEPAGLPPTSPDEMKKLWPQLARKSAWLPKRDWLVSLAGDQVEFIDSDHLTLTDGSSDLNRFAGQAGLSIVTLSDDGRYLAVGSRENILIWDLLRRDVATRLVGPDRPRLNFLSGGNHLLILGQSPKAYQRRRSPYCHVIAGSPMLINRFALLNGRNELLTMSNARPDRHNSRGILWNTTTGDWIQEVIAHCVVRIDEDFALAPDNRRLVASLGKNWLHIAGWYPRTDSEAETGNRVVDSSQARVFTSDGDSFWNIVKNRLEKRSAKNFNIIGESESLKLTTVDQRYNCLALSRKRLVAGRGTGVIDLFDEVTGAHLSSILVSKEQIFALAEFADGRLLASDAIGNIHIVNATTKEVTTLPNQHKGRVPGLAVHPNQTTLVTGGIDGQLIVWKQTADNGWTPFARLPANGQPVRQAEFNSDGNRLYVLLDRSHHVLVWQLDRLPEELGFD
ncbi:serine/threonine-protein kinase [Zavarzinella formosa]|uniref:serine/threonine-protein kinase n=1 Tax=Zavarzinella formosa TaxID=360055 RepID=UPI0002D9E550|nr:serine/threonine-protein kinase [Zavarzinella formosa]